MLRIVGEAVGHVAGVDLAGDAEYVADEQPAGRDGLAADVPQGDVIGSEALAADADVDVPAVLEAGDELERAAVGEVAPA